MNTTHYSNTPTGTVLDNRGLTVRDIVYHRHPGAPDVTCERLTRYRYNARGVLSQSTDPRLHDAGLANFTYLMHLAGERPTHTGNGYLHHRRPQRRCWPACAGNGYQ